MTDLVIDVHAHYMPKLAIERFDAHKHEFPSVALTRGDHGSKLAFAGGEATRPISPKLGDLDDRKQWMDKNGIDHQLIGGWLDAFGYELPAAEGAAWSRYLNRCLLDGVKPEPRFTALATVPLQDGKLAAEVLAEAWEQGFGGIMIGTLPKGLSGVLDSPDLDPFWQKADELGIAIFLHPMFVCGEPRLNDYDLVNAMGRVVDTSIAVSRLLYSGHLLKYGNLKLVLGHGGAALPFALGRLRRNFTIAQGKYADPKKGFEALYFDSVVFDQSALRLLCEVAGDGKVMMGSDMPFPIGDPEPLKVIDEGTYFGDTQRRAMRGGTAQAVFRVRHDRAGVGVMSAPAFERHGVDVPGGRLSARLAGPTSGDMVVFSHSILTSGRMWDAQAALLADKGYRVVLADTRGHGDSAAIAPPYTMDRLGDDIVALLDSLDVRRAHFVGLSLGGMLAFGLGLRHAERFRSLLICDARADMPPEAGAVWDDRIAIAGKQGCQGLAEATIQRWCGPTFAAAHPQQAALLRELIGGTSVDGFTGSARAIQGLDYLPSVGRIRVPVTLLVGSNDAPLPPLMQALNGLIAGSVLEVIPNAGHLPNIDQPAAFDAALLRHLARHPIDVAAGNAAPTPGIQGDDNEDDQTRAGN